ncbi:MAG: hypothetical protein KKC99_01860 [Proteobacteria bacterium]|nr:hypothetical protein [Pseudomonadota bacterium]
MIQLIGLIISVYTIPRLLSMITNKQHVSLVQGVAVLSLIATVLLTGALLMSGTSGKGLTP